MDQVPSISRKFLENQLGLEVETWTISCGSKIGDNYLSIIYSIEVKLLPTGENKEEILYLFSKCCPRHPVRQEFLIKSNVFWNELTIYNTLLPTLAKTAKNMGLDRKLPFPPIIGGSSPNFEELREKNDLSYAGKVFDPFDIYILMTDIRKTWGFKMAYRQAGLDFDHISLVIKAQAFLHSVSWAYKQLKNISTLIPDFPCLNYKMFEYNEEVCERVMRDSFKKAKDIIASKFGPDSAIATGTTRALGFINNVTQPWCPGGGIRKNKFSETHRVKPPKTSEKPWTVLLHGDCWTNNLMFRYDEETKRPCEVTLVDLQLMREQCPTIDLAYLLYSSTTTEFRKVHLNDVLALYYQEFTNNCLQMKVELLPDFSLEELKRRFHESKIFGYFSAITLLPILLIDAKAVVDIEKVSAEDMNDMFNNIIEYQENGDSLYAKRITDLAQEMFDDGVI